MTTAVAQSVLWPPYHDLIDVGLTFTATDLCDDEPLQIDIVVTSDELLAERVANRDLYSLRYRVRQPLQKRLMSNVDSLLEKADAARWRRKFESRLPR